ncbi:fibrinogen-like protein A [Anopheles aquasalis]|uniref:fibrinogen-like protein A n=1 Tax=Anopheles aquasalis TaxID=42839 RepID=UPI00215A2068|nr:fibrinogen-like protein A [Anopheles aquasalis]
MILRKLENIDRKLLELHHGQNELQKEIANIKASQQATCISQVQSYEKVLNSISQQNQSTPSTATVPTTPRTTAPKPKQPPFTSCKEVPYNVSGVYLIHVNNSNSSFNVFCDQENFDGGWIVVQHRFDGSVDFYRNWTEYREGFGNFENEFWLGLEKLHQITMTRVHEIIIEIKDFNGNYGYARYDEFKIGSEYEQYQLTLGKYSGNASDSMSYNKGMKFSASNRDNGNYYRHCAQDFEGAWWYGGCTLANLNGPYKNINHQKSTYWYYFKNDYRGMSFSRMMIRET